MLRLKQQASSFLQTYISPGGWGLQCMQAAAAVFWLHSDLAVVQMLDSGPDVCIIDKTTASEYYIRSAPLSIPCGYPSAFLFKNVLLLLLIFL